MHIIFHSYYAKYNVNNLLFKEAHSDIGDDLLSPFLSIAEKSKSKGIKVSTSYNIKFDDVDAIVFVEQPKQTDLFFQQAIKSKLPLFLITLESPIIMPENYDRAMHDIYVKVFTWSDDLISSDEGKYIKINYSFNFPAAIPNIPKSDKKLLTLISGNKNSKFPNELYSSRLSMIMFMERHYHDEFDFYGIGWDYFVLGQSLIERVINKVKIPRKLFNMHYKSYRGAISRKNSVLKKYAFSVCYENVKDIPGYITEKIFDCFFAGCVPIYLGADNIDNYIPVECYIDMRQFPRYDDLYNFIHLMSEETYQKYINNIQSFLNTEEAQQFSNNSFSSTILNGVLASSRSTAND